MKQQRLSRRDFLLALSGAIAGGGTILTGFVFADEKAVPRGAVRLTRIPSGVRWAFLIDPEKCIGCGTCIRACRTENRVPNERWRTWVERYVYLDTPRGLEIIVGQRAGGEGGYEPVKPGPDEKIVKAFFVPKLCNHCRRPSCVRVCPACATYVSPDGVVLIDEKRCVGCGYCVQACPYGMRFINPETGTADKCTWCYHRITKGLKPVCVTVCPTGARLFGDLTKEDDPVAELIRKKKVYVLRPESGNDPQVRYLNLAAEVI